MNRTGDSLDHIISNALHVLEDSKYQIFEIAENARADKLNLEQGLKELMADLAAVIEKVDALEGKFRLARVRLSEVSKDFNRFSEEDIRKAYEQATQFQLELSLHREKEHHLKVRRDELQKRIKNTERTIERAETITSQMNVVVEYLSGDMSQITRILESAKNRQLLGLKIILAQEEERKRIAREIHDGAAQSLANVVLRAELTERMLERGELDMVRSEIADLKGQVRLGLEEIRKIIFNLRPMTLDDLGMIPTLRKYAHDFQDRTKIHTQFEITGQEIRLPSAMEAAIFRLVQEAFTNVYKHAEATRVQLEVGFTPSLVRIAIQDNGRGFEMGEDWPGASADQDHFGLIGMRERVELLEGAFELASGANEGTKIRIEIPISGEKG